MQGDYRLSLIHFDLIHCPLCSQIENLGDNFSSQRWVIFTRKLVGDFARKLTDDAARNCQ
jgi:hypothetical protein